MFGKIKASWKAKTTEQKVAFVLDILAKIGGGFIGSDIGARAAEGHSIFGQVCARVAGCGLGLAAGDIASNQLQEVYAKPAGALIDSVREKIHSKEAAENA